MAIQMAALSSDVEKPCRGVLGRVTQRVDGRAKRGLRWSIEDCEVLAGRRSVFRTNFHRLHAGFGFGPGLEDTVINYGRCSGRLFIDNGAFLGSRVPHNIVFARDSGLRQGRSDGERNDSAR